MNVIIQLSFASLGHDSSILPVCVNADSIKHVSDRNTELINQDSF